ncbi:hypothetical protein ASD51_24715 [Streptomyces sp. Root55]|nr:hypothetical protein ASD26_00100 [Streptomyces sp. Root1319]KQZ20705.1 hypothetical protein ASD51_24715 [Streptomyces sp. Root55]
MLLLGSRLSCCEAARPLAGRAAAARVSPAALVAAGGGPMGRGSEQVLPEAPADPTRTPFLRGFVPDARMEG